MVTESDMLEIKLQMEALICKREAMIADNTQCGEHGHTVVYGPDDFYNLANRLEDLHKLLVNLIEG